MLQYLFCTHIEHSTCREDQPAGLLTESTPNLSVGISGQANHSLVSQLKQLLNGGDPLESTAGQLHFDIWVKVRIVID